MFAGRWRRGFRAGLAAGGELFFGERLVVAGFGRGTGLAENFFVTALDVACFAVVVDAFAAVRAEDAGGFVAGHLAGVDGDRDPLFAEEVRVGEFAVGEHLLLVFILDVRVEVAGALPGGFEGGDADGFVDGGVVLRGEGWVYWRSQGWGYRRSQIDEGGGHLAPVAEFDGALAEAAASDDGDGVGGAAVDLDEGDEALAVLWSHEAAGVVDAEAKAAEDGQADTEDLAGAEVSMGCFGFAEEGFEGLHGLMILLFG
jgi:hypothetical protein